MPPESRLQSYAPDVVKGKAILFTFLASFLAAYKGQQVSASTPSLASSVVLQTSSAVSPSGGVSPTQTSVRPSSTASPSLPQTFQISIHLSQTPWHEDLYNKQSPTFVALATNLTKAVSDALNMVGDTTVEVVEFKPGSVIAVLNVTTLSSNETDIKSKLTEEMKNGQLGGFSVDPTLYSGTLFDVVLRVVSVCNDSLPDKGFDQKEEFERAISKEMSVNPKFLGANIQRIDCSAADNITIVTTRVQIGGPSTFSPYKELSHLRSQVEAGRVGNFTVVPDWNSFSPGGKVFYVYVTLQTETVDTALTRNQLEVFVESEFKSEDNFRYVHATTPDSKTAIIEIGMAPSTSEFLSVALNPLASDLFRAKLGSVTVVKKENRVTIDTRSLTRKTFDITFVQYVSSCEDNSSHPHYKNLTQGFWRFIDERMKANKINEVYLETKVKSIKCQNSTTLRGFASIYLKPTAPDDIDQFLRPFYKCKELINIYNAGMRIALKTPTQPDTEGQWSPALGGVTVTYVCPKPKPPPKPTTISTTTTPTPHPKSSPSTTGSKTTEASLSSTGKTTDEPSNATNPTQPPETTAPPTTRVILPTLAIEPELYIKLKLGLTWGEFCSKRDDLKKRIARNLFDSNGTRVSPDRIVYVNVERNCADPVKKDELAVVWFFVSNSGSKQVHKDLTFKAYELFKMFFKNANTKQLGPDFEEKVVEVELAGNDASSYEKVTDCKMASWMIILLAIAGAVGLFLMLLACCCLFCCGVRRRRRRKKYGTEHAQALHVVYVDSNGRAPGAAEEKEQKNGTGKSRKKPEEDDGKNKKEHGEKDGFENGGCRESHSKDKSETSQNTTDGKGNCSDQEDKSPTRKLKAVNGESTNAYGSLNKTADGVAEHTYASLNKAGTGKNSSGTIENNNNAGYIAMTAPVPNKNIDRSGDRSAGGDIKTKADSGSSDVNFARAGEGGESPNSGSQSKRGSLFKADGEPKCGERRGSSVYYASIDDDVPLTHKTGTVGIVALAIRNKNETKKQTEFKNLDKDVLNELVKYPPETASKNRSPDVLPVPRTRVKLSTSPDYINANWIRDHKGQISYIATQHPLHETTEDFWRMVWDQKAHTVVMVNDEEKEKPADFVDYLPNGQGNSKQFGDINVTVKQITKKADYVLTILSIVEGKKATSPREVSHMRFTSWKERTMPNVALFVAFVTATREARKKHGETKAPTIVHCSDGLGFSGVYIAVDIGIRSNEESKTSVVDVFELSKNLRRDRHGIVCTLEHYNFIYQALYEYTVNYNESLE